VVHETLNGRSSRIKGFTIAQDVFGLDDPDDAQTSTIVSVQARRLRRRLDEYYANEGKNDPIRIQIPKGTYVPVFEPNSITGTGNDTLSTTQAKATEPHRSMRDQRLPLVLFTVIVIAVGLIWLSQSPFFKPTTQPHESGNLAIAVLPFQNMTDDPSNDQLAMGLTEDIITDLSKISRIDVIAFSSVLPFQARVMTPQDIGKELAVTHSLRGSIRGAKPNLRVTAELVETQSGKQVWAKRFERQLVDVLKFQAELALKVVDGMSVPLRGGRA
jgi:adenylate cyclase